MKFEYNKEVVKDNLREMHECLSYSFIEENKYWYNQMQFWCKELSDKIDVPLTPVVGVFAALSPMCSLRQNKIICEGYFAGFEKHTKSQIDKANRITSFWGYLTDDYETQKKQIMTYLGGMKTKSFFDNIISPNESKLVTLDRHAIRIATGEKRLSITDKMYKFLEECYLEVAKEVGLSGLQLQAVLWQHWRDSNNKSQHFD